MGQGKLGLIALGAAALLLAGVFAWRALPPSVATPVAVSTSAAASTRAPEDATRERPNDPEAWRTLGLARFDAQDFAGAAHRVGSRDEACPQPRRSVVRARRGARDG